MTETQTDARFSPDAEKAIDAVLAEIMGPGGDDDEDGAEEVQDEEQPEPDTRAEEEEDEDAEEASSEPATQEPDAEWQNARTKLQYAGFSKAYLDSLDREQTIREWSQRAPRESEIQQAFRERAELQKRIEQLEATKQAEQGEPTATLDLSDLEKRAVEELGDLGKDLVAALRGSQAKPAPTNELQEQLAASTAMLQDLIRERAQAELGKRFPTLRKNPEVYGKTERLAGQLAETDLHRDVPGVDRYKALMESAATLLGIDAVSPETDREASEKRSRLRAQGTPTRGGKTVEPKSRTAGELLDAKIRYIQSNPNAKPEDVRKHFGG